MQFRHTIIDPEKPIHTVVSGVAAIKPFIGEKTHVFSIFRVIRNGHAAVTGGHVFRLLEAKATDVTNRSQELARPDTAGP